MQKSRVEMVDSDFQSHIDFKTESFVRLISMMRVLAVGLWLGLSWLSWQKHGHPLGKLVVDSLWIYFALSIVIVIPIFLKANYAQLLRLTPALVDVGMMWYVQSHWIGHDNYFPGWGLGILIAGFTLICLVSVMLLDQLTLLLVAGIALPLTWVSMRNAGFVRADYQTVAIGILTAGVVIAFITVGRLRELMRSYSGNAGGFESRESKMVSSRPTDEKAA